MHSILDCWFGPKENRDKLSAEIKTRWWKKDPEFDALIKAKFLPMLENAAEGKLDNWANSPEGRLALIILLDQFTRNIYRNTSQAFSCDSKALTLTLEGIKRNDDQQLAAYERAFFYMPLMHSENRHIQSMSIIYFQKLVDSVPVSLQKDFINNLNFAKQHKAIIDQFGRYPHRNQLLGRESTEEEIAFLKKPGSSF